MYSSSFVYSILFVALGAYAQSSMPAASSATPTLNASSQPLASGASGAGASPTGNLANLVDYLIPTASITSLSPAQSSKIASDALKYFSQYTSAHPVAGLEGDLFLAQIGATTSPSGPQESSIEALLAAAPSGVVNNPSAYISSVNAIISPFPFATEVQTYESGLIDGMRTVVANDLSLSVPPASAASASTSTGAAAPARPTGVIAGGVAVAAGIVGAALL